MTITLKAERNGVFYRETYIYEGYDKIIESLRHSIKTYAEDHEPFEIYGVIVDQVEEFDFTDPNELRILKTWRDDLIKFYGNESLRHLRGESFDHVRTVMVHLSKQIADAINLRYREEFGL